MFYCSFLAGCGPSIDDFAKQCESISGIDVQDERLWRDYLLQRNQVLARLNATANDKEIKSTDLSPVVITDNYRWTNDSKKYGNPNVPNGYPYKNDVFVIQIGTEKPVARFRNLSMSVQYIDTNSTYNCIDNYPELYTGAHATEAP